MAKSLYVSIIEGVGGTLPPAGNRNVLVYICVKLWVCESDLLKKLKSFCCIVMVNMNKI